MRKTEADGIGQTKFVPTWESSLKEGVGRLAVEGRYCRMEPGQGDLGTDIKQSLPGGKDGRFRDGVGVGQGHCMLHNDFDSAAQYKQQQTRQRRSSTFAEDGPKDGKSGQRQPAQDPYQVERGDGQSQPA